MAGYVPINRSEMRDLLIGEMGFEVSETDRASEMIFVRDVITRSGKVFPYQIKVYSTVLWRTGWTDECGADAIRVVLIDKITGKPAAGKQKRVHRTKNALPNLRQRCRDAFKIVLESETCPKCQGIMNERENKKSGHRFLGCARYAPGKPTHCDTTVQLEKEYA